MSDKKEPVKFIISDETRKAIAAYGTMAAEAEKAKAKYENPDIGADELKHRQQVRKAEAVKSMSEEMNGVIEFVNKHYNAKAAKGEVFMATLNKGPVTIAIASQKDVDRFLVTYIELDKRDLADEKASYEAQSRQRVQLKKDYIDKRAQMESLLQDKEAAVKAAAKGGKAAPYFTDYDMATIADLGRAITEEGRRLIELKQLDASEHQLLLDQHRYEQRAFQSRAPKDLESFYDRGRLDVLATLVKREEVALAAEHRAKEAVLAALRRAPQITETREASLSAPTVLPAETLPMPRTVDESPPASKTPPSIPPAQDGDFLSRVKMEAKQVTQATLRGELTPGGDFQPLPVRPSVKSATRA